MEHHDSSISGGTDPRPLHLAKFVPEEAVDQPPQQPQGEGPTVMIRRIAAKTVEAHVTCEELENDEYGLPLREMLGVISHCFARGVFCSKDIAQLLKDEPALRKAIGRKLPDEDTIRRFRRRFAVEIQETLDGFYQADISQAPIPTDPDAEGKTEFIKRQAAERLHEASWTDNTKGRLG